MEQIDYRHQGNDRMMTGRAFDHLNRLTRVLAISTNGALLSFAYGYNRAGQRTNAVLADGSHWQYQYDPLGQLTNAHRHWNDHALVPAQPFAFAFDDIANRVETWSVWKSSSRREEALDSLVPRRERHKIWSTVGTNHLAAAWLPVTVTASQGATNQTNAGHLFLPTTPETFTHDLDGNLTSAGRWTNTWGAENRLLTMQTRAAAYNVGAPHQNMVFTSPWQGRRISKTVRTWTSAHCPLFTGHCPLFTGHCPLFTGHCPLFTGHCPLFTDHCSLFTDERLITAADADGAVLLTPAGATKGN